MTTPTDFKVSGPKGGVLIRHAKAARVAKALPGLVRRFKRVTVSPARRPRRARSRAHAIMLLPAPARAACALRAAPADAVPHDRHARALKRVVNAGVGIKLDCSESATLICRLAGIADPNGLGYDGTGWTGTLIQHGNAAKRKIKAAQARVGDLVVFGAYPGHHVCTVLEAGADPLLFSHGQERGPLAIRFSEERQHQPSPAQFYRVV
jgi:hypothetical protein